MHASAGCLAPVSLLPYASYRRTRAVARGGGLRRFLGRGRPSGAPAGGAARGAPGAVRTGARASACTPPPHPLHTARRVWVPSCAAGAARQPAGAACGGEGGGHYIGSWNEGGGEERKDAHARARPHRLSPPRTAAPTCFMPPHAGGGARRRPASRPRGGGVARPGGSTRFQMRNIMCPPRARARPHRRARPLRAAPTCFISPHAGGGARRRPASYPREGSALWGADRGRRQGAPRPGRAGTRATACTPPTRPLRTACSVWVPCCAAGAARQPAGAACSGGEGGGSEGAGITSARGTREEGRRGKPPTRAHTPTGCLLPAPLLPYASYRRMRAVARGGGLHHVRVGRGRPRGGAQQFQTRNLQSPPHARARVHLPPRPLRAAPTCFISPHAGGGARRRPASRPRRGGRPGAGGPKVEISDLDCPPHARARPHRRARPLRAAPTCFISPHAGGGARRRPASCQRGVGPLGRRPGAPPGGATPRTGRGARHSVHTSSAPAAHGAARLGALQCR
jgi:hypothetical protein